MNTTRGFKETKKAVTKRHSSNKQKLKDLEWTDEAIEEVSNLDLNTRVQRDQENAVVQNDMDSKIARVQMRKKEAAEREERKRLLPKPPPRPESVLSHYSSEVKVSDIDRSHMCNKLTNALNIYFRDYLAENPYLLTMQEAAFPLERYDSSLHNDGLPLSAEQLPAFGSCLIAVPGPETSPTERGLGEWHACKVVAVDTESGEVTVEISSLIMEETQRLTRMQVCLVDHNPELYSARITEALQRRHQCIGLLKYHTYISSMPVNPQVTATMTDEQFDRIFARAASSARLAALDPGVGSGEISEARAEFETCMNKILFDLNILSVTNTAFLRSLALPSCALQKFPAVPQVALVAVPPHNMKGRLNFHRTHSYINSTAAVTSLQEALRENCRVHDYLMVNIEYTKTFSLEKFDRYMGEQLLSGSRRIKQEWPQKTGAAISTAIAKCQKEPESLECVIYDVALRNVYEFEKSDNAIKSFLDRVNFMMGTELWHIIRSSLLSYAALIEQFCSCEVVVKDVRNIKVNFPENSIYKQRVLPPLFSVAFRIAAEDKVLNTDELAAYEKEMAAWKKTKEAEAGEKCPIKPVKAVYGRTFEYSHSVEEFKEVVVRTFKHIVRDFLDVPHVQKFVMDHIYFPNPKYIESVTEDLDFVTEARERMEAALDRALAPLTTYLKFFKKYETFVNIDNAAYIASKITVTEKDPDSQEIELPVVVSVEQVRGLIDEHLKQIEEIEQSLPVTPIECGMFLVEVVSVRHLLLDKHRQIIRSILAAQAERCAVVVHYLEDEFKRLNRNLSKRPENIEQLCELEEYVSGLGSTMNTLQGCIGDMRSNFSLMDKYKFRTDFDVGAQMWAVFGAPAKVATKCVEVAETNVSIKKRFREEMLGEQATFSKAIQELEQQVIDLQELIDLEQVTSIAATVKELEVRLTDAQTQVRLFNSREGLFESDVTDYEHLNRIQKNFEPYLNLWQTTKEWLELSDRWMQGRFVDLNAEEVENSCDRFAIAINKAAKFFSKGTLHHQMTIANKIKTQIAEFVPEVPMIVTLRNPGMRDRHWKRIAEDLGVDIHPIDDFTTEQIIALNLKDSLELIQKIGESAAKEYQIEQALDKMEREWENMNLLLHSYRETGTAVLKGVDDINVILDEQITMTQVQIKFSIYNCYYNCSYGCKCSTNVFLVLLYSTPGCAYLLCNTYLVMLIFPPAFLFAMQTIMFSAFKGPFEERIDEWNRKLCNVSDVLEVWVAVQRNWLYLQPIFESPDINRQLPTEGKKFSTVDKSWRQTISAAKVKSKVIEFCDSTKLLERFKESELLLDQVQKGLSDYLETKRSVFARFYFLSNDELLSILSESKDVKLVQPHLKKCFEGIDKVKFLSDLTIDRMISPENEEMMLTEKIDPNEKNVEHWMLELEGMMRISVRDAMRRAIEDYTVTPRPKWMQKHAGMCVLNGSQMHWTTEMEQLFIAEGAEGPSIMLQRQFAQLADMTILVRGQLSKAARVTVGALTVIDVHARDVIAKLVDEKVDTKDNFAWTSQLRYYWDGTDLTAEMVAARRPYGYEYLGNTFRLVITPLTDKCYLTLMGALQMIFGGAPAGPAGTGKTETTKGMWRVSVYQSAPVRLFILLTNKICRSCFFSRIF